MSAPPVSDELKCKFVVTEIPKFYCATAERPNIKKLLAGFWNVVAYYKAAQMDLRACPKLDQAVDINMRDLGLTEFLLELAEKGGVEKEEEYKGVLWKFVRVTEESQ